MNAQDFRSPIGLVKIATILLGIAILAVGLHSHFQSSWKKHYYAEACEGYKSIGNPLKLKCPPIEMEQFYISTIIICFVASILVLLASLLFLQRSFRIIDAGYHLVAAIALMAAAIIYIVSSEHINYTVKALFLDRTRWLNFRREEKLVAGALTVLQSLLCGAVAIMTCRR